MAYIGVMGVPDGMKASSTETHQAFPAAGVPESVPALIMSSFNLPIEARYATVTRELQESSSKAMFDIACGYTPRAIYCHQNGIDYRRYAGMCFFLADAS